MTCFAIESSSDLYLLTAHPPTQAAPTPVSARPINAAMKISYGKVVEVLLSDNNGIQDN